VRAGVRARGFEAGARVCVGVRAGEDAGPSDGRSGSGSRAAAGGGSGAAGSTATGAAAGAGGRGGGADSRGQSATSATTAGSATTRATLPQRTRRRRESGPMTAIGDGRPRLAPCYRAPPPETRAHRIMAAPDPTYDLTVLLDTAAPEDQRAKILSDVEKMISNGGTVVGKHDWGPRTMAYEIRHKADAEYHLIQFHGTPELLANLQRTLRITDGVMRFRIIKLEPGTPEPPAKPETVSAPAAEAPAPA
jgi:small subunit ribosomal protein S6